MLEIFPNALLVSKIKVGSGDYTNIENINDLRQKAAKKADNIRLKVLEKTNKLRKSKTGK